MEVRQYSLKAPKTLWARLEAERARRPHMNINALICDILDRGLANSEQARAGNTQIDLAALRGLAAREEVQA